MATNYNPYYSGGWQSGEEGGTPITPDALNHIEDGIAGAYGYTQRSTAFHVGDTFRFHGAQIPFRALNNKSAINFRYRLPKNIGSDITGFTITVTLNSPTWYSGTGSGLGTIQSGTSGANTSIDGNTIAFQFVPPSTISTLGFGLCELAATVLFT